jgi:WLM domain
MSSDESWIHALGKSIFSGVLQGGQYPLINQQSDIDGKTYRVRDLPDKKKAANLLASVRIKMQKLQSYLSATYPDKPQVLQLKRNFIADPSRLLEATPDAEHTSYSVNKGESVHLCLRQRSGQDEQLVDENIMVFVSLHEMAHMITPTIGHNADFWNNFGWLLKEAEKTGIYKHQNFAAHPVSYCGVKITDEPTYKPEKDGAELSIGSVV